MQTHTVHNWFGNITSSPRVVVEVDTVEDIVAVVTDPEHYPNPVRGRGVQPLDDTVTAQAGALYIDVNEDLRRHRRQFFVNVELGNMTIGSAATGGTKDASMPGEFGQIASYAVRLKMVLPSGDLLEVTDADANLLQTARSSYGLFGIVYEATFRVRPLAAMRVHHETFSLEEFSGRLPELRQRDASLMLYINPFKNSITVELRSYHEDFDEPEDLSTWQWRLRNHVWSHKAPLYAHRVTRLVPWRRLRSALIDGYIRLIVLPRVPDPRWVHTPPGPADQVSRGRRRLPVHVQHLGFPGTAVPRLPAGILRAQQVALRADRLPRGPSQRGVPHPRRPELTVLLQLRGAGHHL